MNLPSKVTLIEVGPRDGFQNIEKFIPTDMKIEVIENLIDSGFKKIQITSFVHPKAIPQMKDSKEVASAMVEKYKDIVFVALVPNLYGAKSAYEAGIRNISFVISASETHNKENVNRSVRESFEELAKIKSELPELKIKLDIATAFGCPFEGKISIEKIFSMIENAISIDVDEIFLADTIGVGNPSQVDDILKRVSERFPERKFGLHMHDTRGMGLANILVALQNGFTTFESAIGGLGGCPFAPGAAGNIATEDLINMIKEMGIPTEINLPKLIKITSLIKSSIKPDLTSHMANVCIK